MAIDKVVVPVEVSSNGTTDKEIQKANALKAAYDRVKAAAKQEGTPGSRAAAKYSSGGIMTDDEYNTAKGITGTGASARDFAKQAQGLGGLVRLYATWAANIFAAGAAFRALSEAADTTNMINGMNQLGAAAGRSLGSISKSIVEVTDGAISLRDAMEATTKGAAAGLSTTQMGQMAEVAKKASQSLGIAMPDALSRLSRGISKLEPELLDELGLYTKLDKATQDYARSVGKSTTSLTDFEKRQAFATAVLKEGLDKFAAVDTAANPYDKLLASSKNLAQSGLELLNKVLGPIANLLSTSPTALAAVFASIASMIVSRAIPAVGQFRAGLHAAAEEAAKTAERFKSSFGDEFQTRLERRFKIPDLEADLKKAEMSLSRLTAPKKLPGSVSLLASGSDVDKKTLDNVTEALERRNKLIETGMRGSRKASESQIEAAKEESRYIGAAINAYEKRQALIQGQEKLQTVTDKPLSRFDPEVIALKKYQQLRDAAAKSELVYNAAQNAQIVGVRNSWALLNQEISEKGLKGFAKFSTQVSGGLAAIGSRITGIIGAFGMWGQVIAAGAAAIGILDNFASKANKELDNFNKSLDNTDEAATNLDRTLMFLSKNKGMTSEGVAAVATAYNELSQALTTSADKATEFIAKAEGWDKFKQSFKSIFKMDVGSELAKDISTRVSKAIDLADTSEAKTKFTEKLQETFGGETNIQKIVGTDEDKARTILKLFQEYAKEIGNSASRMTELRSSLDQTLKVSQDLSNSFMPSDNLGKFGMAMFDVSRKMEASMGKPLEQFRELNDIVKDTSKMALFGDIGKELSNAAPAIQMLGERLASTEASIASYKVDLAKAEKDLKWSEDISTISDRTVELRNKVKALREAISHLNGVDAELQSGATKYADLFKRAQIEAATKGADLISASIHMAFEKSALSLERSRATGWTGAGAAASELKVSLAEISLQEKQINAQIDNTRALKDLTLKLEEDSLARKQQEETDIKKKAQIGEQLQVVQTQRAMLGAGYTYKEFANLAKDKTVSDTGRQAAAGMMQFGAQMASSQAQLNDLKTQAQIKKEEAARKEIQEKLNEYVQGEYTTRKNQLTTEQSRLQTMSQITSGLTTQYDIALADNKLEQMDLDNQKAAMEYAAKYLELLSRSGTEKERANLVARESDRIADGVNKRAIETQNKEKLVIEDKYLAEKTFRENQFQTSQQALQFTEQMIGLNKEYSQLQNSLGLITDQQAESERKALDVLALENSYKLESLRIEKDRADKAAEYQLKLSQAPAGTDTSKIKEAQTASENFYKTQKDNLDIVTQKKRDTLALDQSMSDKMKGFAKIVEDAFNNMADAIVEWARTGKLSGKDLFNSLIADLLRYEMRAQMSSLYKGMGGLGGILGAFGFRTGSSAPSQTMFMNDAGGMELVGSLGFANGGVFDAGLQKFAKGGMFTNSIVTSPTLFKFAQGTGLMGEAGPEAIMPLKRDANGNLGVRAGSQQGGDVSVVVNNYSTAQATTQETQDARGNRRIEVVIGEAAAGEMSRPGSNTQGAMRSTYGLAPQLIRR